MKIIVALAAVWLYFEALTVLATPFRQGLRKGELTTLSHRSLQNNDDDDDDNGRGRECELKQSMDEVEFECKSKTTNANSTTEIEDKIDFNVKNRDARGLVVKVEYEQEVETKTNEEQETETETSYEVVFDRIIEYTKGEGSLDNNDAYDWENDNVLQTMSLAYFGAFTPVVDSPTSSVFSVGSSNGHTTMFTFTIHRASDGESINANKMKIDFLLENFPWTNSNSFVALVSEVESKRQVEVEYKDRKEEPVDVAIDFAEAVRAINGVAPFGSYTWETTAIVNSTFNASTSINVVATSPKVPLQDDDGEAKRWIAFSFVGEAAKSAPSIYWDPEAGIGYRRTGIGRRSKVVGWSIGVFVVVAIAALVVWLVMYKGGGKKMRSIVSRNK